MTEKEIRNLIDKYFEGDTTLAEERELALFFSTAAEVPSDLAYAREFFGHLEDASAAKMPDGIPVPKTRRKMAPRRRLLGYMSWAAALTLMFTMGVGVLRNAGVDSSHVYCYVNGQPVYDVDEAFAHTQDVLELVRASLSKPFEALATLDNYRGQFEKMNRLAAFTMRVAAEVSE